MIIKKDNNNDDFDDNDLKQLFAISEIFIEDITDPAVIDDYYFRLEDDLTIAHVSLDDELPNSLFQDVQDIDGVTFMDMFHDTIDAIHENKKASKAIAAFRKAVGDAPVCDYLGSPVKPCVSRIDIVWFCRKSFITGEAGEIVEAGEKCLLSP